VEEGVRVKLMVAECTSVVVIIVAFAIWMITLGLEESTVVFETWTVTSGDARVEDVKRRRMRPKRWVEKGPSRAIAGGC